MVFVCARCIQLPPCSTDICHCEARQLLSIQIQVEDVVLDTASGDELS